MRKFVGLSAGFLVSAALTLLVAQQVQVQLRHVNLPTSKELIGRAPGLLTSLNGFTPTMVVSPDKRYAALLHDGYGSRAIALRNIIQRPPLHNHGAVIGCDQARDHFPRCALARSVLAKKGKDFAGLQVQRQIVERAYVAIPLGDLSYPQDGTGAAG